MEGKSVKAGIVIVAAGLILGGSAYSFWQQKSAPPPAPAVMEPIAAAKEKQVDVVHVSGAVLRPGVLNIPAGGRVMDAIQAAGGLLPGADTSKVNLAQLLKDGMHIHVPGGQAAAAAPSAGAGTRSSPVAGGRTASGSIPPTANAVVNINIAGKAELDQLPGIGPALADRIIEYRTTHGLFRTTADLKNVRGISDSKYEKLKNQISVE